MRKKTVAIMMYGYPATGKTFIAKKLTDYLKEKYKTLSIATLDFRKKFNLSNLESDEQRNKVYDLLAEHIGDVIKNSDYDIIIIDGNFNKRHRREKLYSALGASTVYVIKCVVTNEKVIEERMRERHEHPNIPENKASTMDLYYMIKNASEDVEEDELVKTGVISLIRSNSENNVVEKISLSGGNSIPEVTNQILTLLKNIP